MGTLRKIFEFMALIPGFMPEKKRQQIKRKMQRKNMIKSEWQGEEEKSE